MPASPDTVRLRLDIAYDGAGFAGWARQPRQRTVQGVLEEALTTVLRLAEPVRLTVAGRTDSGVHARGQVAHLDVPPSAWAAVVGRSDLEPADALVRRLAGVLARAADGPRGTSDVVVHRAGVVSPDFDARFAALWRRYSYRVIDTTGPHDPWRRGHELWHRAPLDAEAMDVAAGALCGEHDFLAYCKPREGATTIRTLQHFAWHRLPPAAGGGLVADVRADAFCHSMVRSLVGACLAVGEGRRDVAWPSRKLAAQQRDPAVQVAPAHGLTLEDVGYPPVTELAQRAAAARNVRGRPR